MIPTRRTFPRPFTFRQFLFRIFTYVVTITLFFMTWLTEMCVSPTKPLGCGTTKFAFKLNKIFAMFWTILYRNLTTVWTY